MMASVVNEDEPVVVADTSDFSVRLQMFTDDSFTQTHTSVNLTSFSISLSLSLKTVNDTLSLFPRSFPVAVSAGDELHMAASLDSPDEELRVSLESCWISESGNVYSNSRQYILHN